MMHKTLEDRIHHICEGVSSWLENEDGILDASCERTVSGGLFPKHDVIHMLEQVGCTITPRALWSWFERVSTNEKGATVMDNSTYKATKSDQSTNATAFANPATKVLCLHAGNLPMVGLQDIIATLLSGAAYHGKLSGNDPWLLDGLLRVLKKHLPDQVKDWAIRLEELDAVRADAVLFAGSQASVNKVAKRIDELRLADEDSRFLTRTARFSIARLQKEDFRSDRERLSYKLIESMLRYEGRGCRSVALVVADRELSDFAGYLMEAADLFTRSNPPSQLKNPGVTYWKSYLKSTGREVYDLGGHIITDDRDLAGKENVICWIKGSDVEVTGFAEKFGSQLQSVYVNADRAAMSQKVTSRLMASKKVRLEPLSEAQSPPVDWRPDGVDVLSWLCGCGSSVDMPD